MGAEQATITTAASFKEEIIELFSLFAVTPLRNVSPYVLYIIVWRQFVHIKSNHQIYQTDTEFPQNLAVFVMVEAGC